MVMALVEISRVAGKRSSPGSGSRDLLGSGAPAVGHAASQRRHQHEADDQDGDETGESDAGPLGDVEDDGAHLVVLSERCVVTLRCNSYGVRYITVQRKGQPRFLRRFSPHERQTFGTAHQARDLLGGARDHRRRGHRRAHHAPARKRLGRRSDVALPPRAQQGGGPGWRRRARSHRAGAGRPARERRLEGHRHRRRLRVSPRAHHAPQRASAHDHAPALVTGGHGHVHQGTARVPPGAGILRQGRRRAVRGVLRAVVRARDAHDQLLGDRGRRRAEGGVHRGVVRARGADAHGWVQRTHDSERTDQTRRREAYRCSPWPIVPSCARGSSTTTVRRRA